MILLVREVLSAKLALRYEHKFEAVLWRCLKIKRQQTVFYFFIV